jgi:hypothetical protein
VVSPVVRAQGLPEKPVFTACRPVRRVTVLTEIAVDRARYREAPNPKRAVPSRRMAMIRPGVQASIGE